MTVSEGHGAGVRESRRDLFRLAGGVLGATAAASLIGCTPAFGSAAGSSNEVIAGEFPAAGLSVILTVPEAGDAVDLYLAAFDTQVLVAAKRDDGRTFLAQLLVYGNLVGVASESQSAGLIAPPSPDQATMWVTQFVSDIDAVLTRASSAGVSVLDGPVAMADLMVRACLRDPYGYNWQTFQVLRSFTAEELEDTLEQGLGKLW